jgi:hypothetical protein
LAYLGNRPAESFASFEKQVFTIVNSQTAYTLSHSVTNENDIRLVVNNVVQEPGSGKAYTASGTTLTLSAALTNGTDEMYCVFLGRALQTVNAPNASVGSDQTAPTIITGQTELATAPASTDELLISDAGVLKRIDVSLIGGTNTPAFRAFMNANQNLSDATTTKIDQFGSEDFDTDNNFASNRFTPTTAGKYFVFVQLSFTNTTDADVMYYAESYIYKNGSQLVKNTLDPKNSNPSNQALLYNATVVDMNGSSDYLEVYANSGVASGAPKIGNGTNQSYFGAYKIIE